MSKNITPVYKELIRLLWTLELYLILELPGINDDIHGIVVNWFHTFLTSFEVSLFWTAHRETSCL